MGEQSKRGRKPRVTDGEVLDVLRETDDPVLSTAEVANELPIKRRATLTRLQRLAENGDLGRKQIGGRNTVWWLSDEETISPEARLKRLSNELDESIVVAGRVYERGDVHTLDATEAGDTDWREGYGSWTGTDLAAAVEDLEGDLPDSVSDDRTAIDERVAKEILDDLEAVLRLAGLFDDDEAAARARKRSKEWVEAFDEQLMNNVDDASVDEL